MRTLSFEEKLKIVETLKSLKERYNSLFKLDNALAIILKEFYSPNHTGYKKPAYYTHTLANLLTDSAFSPDEKLKLFETVVAVLKNAMEQQRILLQQELDRIQIQIAESDEFEVR
jgi:hypothetical protein